MTKRHLTKSRFKIGVGCPTKLHFLDNAEYGNSNSDNTFLQALAEGGFQVGELAKLYYPGGTEIKTLDKEKALAETALLLSQDKATIYEGALLSGDLFIRADIIIKSGKSIHLIEVKAKSYDPTGEDRFYTKTSLKKGLKKIHTAWEPYLLDVAFQCHVVRAALPGTSVRSSLMLADKSVIASVDGLNQMFALEKDSSGRVSARVAEGVTGDSVGRRILVEVPVDEEIEIIRGTSYQCGDQMLAFNDLIEFLSVACSSREFVKPEIGSHCKGCEFRINGEMKSRGLKSGFEKCWSEAAKIKPKDFAREFIFDIWNFRKSKELINSGKYFIDQVTIDDIDPSSNTENDGLSNSERQWIQVEKVTSKDKKPFIDLDGLKTAFAEWTYPLHFIDFETTMAAIPFHSGRKPYEQIAFQFSHHIVHNDGRIEHADEYICAESGRFPNFDFVRALRKSLSDDAGTIFRFAAHENTVLNQIKKQLLSTSEPVPDKEFLISFIESVTTFEDGSGEHIGERNMVDLCELVKKYFYHPRMKGSNSIKKVLPAILNSSNFLKAKYSLPIYGNEKGVTSKNFEGWTWVQLDDKGEVKDPYKILPPIFDDIELEEMDSLILDGSIADGGAAMTAFARMQFTAMTEKERERTIKALLKYCELDTFAMVMIYEYWKSEIDRVLLGKAA